MRDPRTDQLADLLVNYSVRIKPQDKVILTADFGAQPLAEAVFQKVLQAGGYPLVQLEMPRQPEIFFRYASEDQINFVHPTQKLIIETYDVLIALMGDVNTKALSNVDPARMVAFSQARREISETYMERSAAGALRWVVTLFPTFAYAQDAEMSLSEYEDFVYSACMPDMQDPIGYWQGVHDRQEKIIQWLHGKDQVHITAPGTDLRLRIGGRTFINCDCRVNVPDGEIFTAPVEDSVEGHVTYTYPAIYSGREVEGVQLWFEQGKVVKASAEKNEKFLLETLDTDEGARYLGEFAIGTNDGIQKFTRNILFDEKIGGSFHTAVGAGYPESGSKNKSSIHWDMICDLRDGGEIRVDGELMYQNGRFVLDL